MSLTFLYPTRMHNNEALKICNVASIVIRIISVFLLITLASCSIALNSNHPELSKGAENLGFARVYFIRSLSFNKIGYDDNALKIFYKNIELLELSQGQYTMIKIKPGKGDVSVHSRTKFVNKRLPINIERTRTYHFLAEKTYFIYLLRIDEGFRGIHYDPSPVTLAEAKKLIDSIHAIGVSGKFHIDKIDSIPRAPDAGPLQPLLPENVYKNSSPYLSTKPRN